MIAVRGVAEAMRQRHRSA